MPSKSKATTVKMPLESAAALQNDPALETAYQQFSARKKRGFMEYIGSAKQEKTRLSRLEKCKPYILSGMG